jgi:hypothetical protein
MWVRPLVGGRRGEAVHMPYDVAIRAIATGMAEEVTAPSSPLMARPAVIAAGLESQQNAGVKRHVRPVPAGSRRS